MKYKGKIKNKFMLGMLAGALASGIYCSTITGYKGEIYKVENIDEESQEKNIDKELHIISNDMNSKEDKNTTDKDLIVAGTGLGLALTILKRKKYVQDNPNRNIRLISRKRMRLIDKQIKDITEGWNEEELSEGWNEEELSKIYLSEIAKKENIVVFIPKDR